jgi:hypothetical protein
LPNGLKVKIAFFCLLGASRFIVSNTIFGHWFFFSVAQLFSPFSLLAAIALSHSLSLPALDDREVFTHNIFIHLYLLYKHTAKAFSWAFQKINSIFGNALYYHKGAFSVSLSLLLASQALKVNIHFFLI